MQDDSELVEAALNIIAKHGRLILRRRVWVGGIAYDPAVYQLGHLGPAPYNEVGTYTGADGKQHPIINL